MDDHDHDDEEEQQRSNKRRRRHLRTNRFRAVLQTILLALIQTFILNSTPTHGGSAPGRNTNIDRCFRKKETELFENYFSANPRYSKKHFRRRFRMPYDLFMKIHDDVLAYDPYFQAKRNCTGLLGKRGLDICLILITLFYLGISSHVKITVALRILAQGAAFDVFDERFGISETTSAASLEHFVRAINHIYAAEYLRQPSVDELTLIMEENKDRGFPGCIGSIDCQHWYWKNCPMALQSNFKTLSLSE